MLLFGIFRFCIRGLPYRVLQRATVYLTPAQAAALLSLPFMVLYLAISGGGVPAVRSFIMMTVFLFGLLIGRKGFWLSSLLFAALLICLWDPTALLTLSFQLSFLAVLFIGFSVGERKGKTGDQRLTRRLYGYLKNAILLSLSASLGTAPLVAYSFHYFSILSPVTNLFITPFVGFVLVPSSLLSGFVFLFTGHYPFQSLISGLSGMALEAVKLAASIPYASIPVPAFPSAVVVLFYVGCALFLMGRKRFALSCGILALGLFALSLLQGGAGMSVTYLDVGQGDSAVIETPDRTTVVVDTGSSGRELEAFLRYLGRKTIDALIVTHADEDHAGGVPLIVRKFRVREVWDSGLLSYAEDLAADTIHRGLERGDDISFGGLRILALHPYRGFYSFSGGESTAENNDSLVVKLMGQRSFLFTADAETEAEEDLAHLGGWLRSDVLKVAHHGSRTSSTDEFLQEVSPSIAVISVGRYNDYGHPHRETLERLRGMRVYRTDRDGAIKVIERSDDLTVKTFREFQLEHPDDPAGEWRNIKRLFMKW